MDQISIFDYAPEIPKCYETCRHYWPYMDREGRYPDFYPATKRPRCNGGLLRYGTSGRDVIPVYGPDGKICHRCKVYEKK